MSDDERQVIGIEVDKAIDSISRLSKYIWDNRDNSAAIMEPIGNFIEGKWSKSEYNLCHIPVAACVEQAMPIGKFITLCANAYRMWPTLSDSSGPSLNKTQFGYIVRQSLFANNDKGWDAYKAMVKKSGFENFTDIE